MLTISNVDGASFEIIQLVWASDSSVSFKRQALYEANTNEEGENWSRQPILDGSTACLYSSRQVCVWNWRDDSHGLVHRHYGALAVSRYYISGQHTS